MALSEFTELIKPSQQRNTKISLLAFVFVIAAFLSGGCNSGKKTKEETPVAGATVILADESFRPVLEAEKMIFEALYKDASITIRYVPEIEAINSFLNDSTEIIFTGRRLTPEEKSVFSAEDAPVTEQPFATDGLAFVTHKTFNNSIISADQLKSVLNGKFKTWNQLNPAWPAEEIVVVSDQSNSSNLSGAIAKFGLTPSAVKIYAAGSNEGVADYVSTHPNALGILGGAWLSDEESPAGKKLREKISVLRLKKEDGQEFYPFQASISEEKNPFSRQIFLIRKNINMGVGAGFSTFVLSDRGQRIVLKAGLVPAHMPGREIVIEKEEQN